MYGALATDPWSGRPLTLDEILESSRITWPGSAQPGRITLAAARALKFRFPTRGNAGEVVFRAGGKDWVPQGVYQTSPAPDGLRFVGRPAGPPRDELVKALDAAAVEGKSLKERLANARDERDAAVRAAAEIGQRLADAVAELEKAQASAEAHQRRLAREPVTLTLKLDATELEGVLERAFQRLSALRTA